jgi:hypothetical protein
MMGELAASLAHEIKQPIAGVALNVKCLTLGQPGGVHRFAKCPQTRHK